MTKKDKTLSAELVNLTTPIGEVVLQWRKHRGMTQQEFREVAQISRSYVSQLESGYVSHPRKEYLEKIARGLSITVEDLLYRRLPPNDDQDQQKQLPNLTLGSRPFGELIQEKIVTSGLEEDEMRLVARKVNELTDMMIEMVKEKRA